RTPTPSCCHPPCLLSHSSSLDPLSWSSPPVPLSTTWRGGTTHETSCPLARRERGTGGEDHSGAASSLYSTPPHLVRPRGARPAVAPHPRSVSRARVRGHARSEERRVGKAWACSAGRSRGRRTEP